MINCTLKKKTIYVQTTVATAALKDINLTNKIYRNMVNDLAKHIISNGYLMRFKRSEFSDDIIFTLVLNPFIKSDLDFPLRNLGEP